MKALIHNHGQHLQLCLSILVVESGQLLPVLIPEYKCRIEMSHPFHLSSTLLHLPGCVTLSALDSHLSRKGARSATQPAWDWERTLFLFTECCRDMTGDCLPLEGTQHSPSSQISRARQSFLLHFVDNLCGACLLALGWILQSKHHDTKNVPCAIYHS